MNGGRIILAGGSGFLGTLLANDLARSGFEVVILTRGPASASGSIPRVQWNGRTPGAWAEQVNGAGAVVNLTGRNINCRFTPENVREINESRADSVRAVGDAIRGCSRPPGVFVQAAGVSIYGERGDDACDEFTPAGKGFLVETCRLWEGAFEESSTPATRRVLLRIGMVLSGQGGALTPLARLAKLGLGGRAGSGRQYLSWIHAMDIARVFRFAIESENASGIFNASAPNPVTNAEFMHELRRALRRPWSPPVPSWAVHVGARLMGTEPRLALSGCRCVPKRLLEAGFNFEFPLLAGAFANIFSATPGG